MAAAGTKGRIILISSICATAAEPDCAHYNASKGGVSALCKSMALDLAPYGIVTNAIAPGWILSSATEEFVSEGQLAGEERFPLNPVGRIGSPEDIGRAVAWLADPRTTFVSGAVVTVDGAQTAALAYPAEA
jgi:NAD(P)-dependent dehydrogenase (short-subunit alcohol dehydrogenase family)